MSTKEFSKFKDFQMIDDNMLMIRKIPFGVKEIEEQLRATPYRGEGLIKDPVVEKSKIPPIVKFFYQFTFYFGLPTPEELISVYFKVNKKNETDTHVEFKNFKGSFSKKGVIARIYRAYPSLVRDLYFYLLCRDSCQFNKVTYSLMDDLNGTDLNVWYKGQQFRIALFVTTYRSLKYKQMKKYRHEPSAIPEVCVTMDLIKDKYYVGDYALYQQAHLDWMIKEMEQYIQDHSVFAS